MILFETRRLFFICLAVIEAFGILAVILTIHWAINIKVGPRIEYRHKKQPISTFQGGVTYVENMGIPFNWHPILMTISLIFLYGNGQFPINIFISPSNYLDPPQEPSSTGSSPQRARGTN